MKTSHRTLLIIVCFVLLGAGLVVWRNVSARGASHAHGAHAIYHCPMHPNYTSDKPGDCPICNMKLVKREETARDVCYMHNCPKMHEGQPCPMLVVAKAGETVICPVCGMHVAEAAPPPAEKKILYWTDPMLPGYKSDKPGKSPMGMEMVPVYEEAAAGAQAGAAAPPGYAPILVTPQKQQLIGVKTAPVERRSLTKTIRAVGTVAHDPELYQAEAEYLVALQAKQQLPSEAPPEARQRAERLIALSRVRLKHMGLSDALIDEVGTLEMPEHGLLYGGTSGRKWIYAAIYEYELPLVHVGDAVTVELPASGGQTLAGTLRAIEPIVDPATRTVKIRVSVDDAAGALKPEMYVNVVSQAAFPDAVVVPETAVFDTGTQHIIFVDKGQGVFAPRAVELGAQTQDGRIVTAGVTAGERVVTNGNFLIDSESRLKAALEGMSSGAHQHEQ